MSDYLFIFFVLPCTDVFGVANHCFKPDHFRCTEGVYIPNSYLCDGYNYDCLDNLDENEEFCGNQGIYKIKIMEREQS